MSFVTSLNSYGHEYVFFDDNKDFIKGKLNGSKSKLSKSDIKEIYLRNGKQYVVLSNSEFEYRIGICVTQGSKYLFKTYSYVRTSYNASGSVTSGPATVYHILENEGLRVFDWGKELKVMSDNCETFSSYLAEKRIRTGWDIEKAFKFYNVNCD